MANEFYVAPFGGIDVGARVENILEGARTRKKEMDWEKEAPSIIQSKDPDKIADLMIRYPEKQASITAAMGIKRPQTMDKITSVAHKGLVEGGDPKQYLAEVYRTAVENGEVDFANRVQGVLEKEFETPGYASGFFQRIVASNAPERWKEIKELMPKPEERELPKDSLDAFIRQNPNATPDEILAFERKVKEQAKEATPPTPTDADDYIKDLNQASIDETGKPISARERANARIGYKRAQQDEVRKNRLALREVDAATAENIAYNSELGKNLAVIATKADVIKAAGEITPEQKKSNARKGVTNKLATMANYYIDLDSAGEITNVENKTFDNIAVSMRTTDVGQNLARRGFFGKKGMTAQTIRDNINKMKPLLLNDIRSSTDMSARGMDSEKELAFYLQAATDEKTTLQSNIAGMIALDEAYGDGQVASQLRQHYGVDEGLINSIKKQGLTILKGAEKTQPQYQEGQIAVGPGGQRVIFKNGEWRPM